MSYYYPQAIVTLKVLWEDFKTFSDAASQKTYAFSCVPKRLTVNVSDYKTSDTFNCELDYKHFPFDPRTMRSCGVTIHLGDMGKLQNSDGSPAQLVPSLANTIFQGFVDTESLSFDDEHRTVKLEGRDFTSLLIDQKYPENNPIALNQPLNKVLEHLLSGFKATKEIRVVNKTGAKVLPTLAEFYPNFNSPLAGQKNPGAHETYWEIIQDLVAKAGLICYMHFDTLVLSSPRTLYNSNEAVKFIYGYNVKNLEYKRKLGRHKGFNVVVRTLNKLTKEVLLAKIPEEANDDWLKALQLSKDPIKIPVLKPDGTIDTAQAGQLAPYMSFRVRDVVNKPKLIEVGQSIFEDISRQQIEGSFETREMVGHSGTDHNAKNWQVFDLTQLDIGHPLGIDLEAGDLAGISQLATTEARTQFLVTKGYDPIIASAFAKSMGKTANVFYAKSFSYTLDQDTGYKQKIEFINFIDLSNKGLA